MTNNQIQITKQRLRSLFGNWLLNIGICLVIVSWLLVISPMAFASEEKFFEMKAKKFSYNPNIIKVNKGDLVRIRLISEDVHHGFFLDGYGVKTSAHPGQEGSLEFVAEKTGRFSFRCSVTCGEFHPYMVGYLIVEPNTRFHLYLAAVLLFGLVNFSLVTFKKQKTGDG